jgi:hypothetical protein
VVGCCEYGDEPVGSGASESVSFKNIFNFYVNISQSVMKTLIVYRLFVSITWDTYKYKNSLCQK